VALSASACWSSSSRACSSTSYAGGRGEETPRAVLLGGREVTVRVERSWIEEPVGSSGTARRRMFQVRLEDGRRCRLAQEPNGSWTLAHAESGR
jgi:hypothetical protein